MDPHRVLDGLLRALGVSPEHIPPDTQDRKRLYVSVLAAYAQQGQRILVVIDNVSSAGHAVPLLPADGMTGAVVTSRHTLADLDAFLLDLGVLDREASILLLEKILHVSRGPADNRVRDDPEAADVIASLCGDLPLALRIVAALLAEETSRPLAALAAELSEEDTRLDKLQTPQRGIRIVFDLSYQRLDPEPARVFRLLTVGGGPDISTETVAVLTGDGPDLALRALRVLDRAHLIERRHADGRWRLHDLVRLYAASHGQLNAELDQRGAALQRLLHYYVATCRAADEKLRSPRSVAANGRFADLRSALAWLDAERVNLVVAADMAKHTLPEVTIRLVFTLGNFLNWRSRPDDFIALSSYAVIAARHTGDKRSEAAVLGNLGGVLATLRRFDEAIATSENAASMQRELDDRRGEAATLTNLSSTLTQVRRFDDAVAAGRLAVELNRVLGDRRGEGAALINLGSVLTLVGRHSEAQEIHRKAMVICAETGDCRSWAVSAGNLGRALAGEGRIEEAIAAYQQASEASSEIDDEFNLATSLNDLGLTLARASRLDAAVAAHQKAADIFARHGNQHNAGSALNNLSHALSLAGSFEQAIDPAKRAAEIFAELDDLDSAEAALGNLANALRCTGRFNEAIAADTRRADACRCLGDRRGEAIALGYLGSSLVEVGNFSDAIANCQWAARIFGEVGDSDSERKALEKLTHALVMAERYDEAAKTGLRLVRIYAAGPACRHDRIPRYERF